MNDQIGWKFPPTGGGVSDGFRDAGMAHFTGGRISSLARETIQNSLDACSSDAPVEISFEMANIDGSAFGIEELIQIFERCKESPVCHEEDIAELDLGLKVLRQKEVRCLRISDRKTTGLQNEYWNALVKARGFNKKNDPGAGGSHGIGKAAPFVVTPLRAVFYWTRCAENGKAVEKYQGKAVLMSHESDEGLTQGTGYYGIKQDCKELVGEAVPEAIRQLGNNDPTAEGTDLFIVGFQAQSGWQRLIAESVIANYFYAIHDGKLKVLIDSDEEMERRGLDEIDAESLDAWFEYLKEAQSEIREESEEEQSDKVAEAKAFLDAVKEVEPSEKQDKDLGHCKLWIKTEEGMPSKVGFVRGTGMLITSEANIANIKKFTGYREFAALCVFDSSKGNELLRRMENPMHDQFEPDRLSENERDMGERALKRIAKWIRAEIKKQAGPPEGTKQLILSKELSKYVPMESDEGFDASGKEGGAKASEFSNVISLERARRKPQPYQLQLPIPDDGEEDEDGGEEGDEGGRGEGEGSGGGGGRSDGPGHGDGEGGTGNRGGGGRPLIRSTFQRCASFRFQAETTATESASSPTAMESPDCDFGTPAIPKRRPEATYGLSREVRRLIECR